MSDDAQRRGRVWPRQKKNNIPSRSEGRTDVIVSEQKKGLTCILELEMQADFAKIERGEE